MIHHTRMIAAAVALLGLLIANPAAWALAPGEFTGGWHNLRFDSTGDAAATIQITGPTSLSLSLDLDGNVFGGPNPGPLLLTGMIQMDGSVIFDDVMGDPTYGDVTNILISALGQVSATGSNVPSDGVTSFIIGGEFTSDDHADLTYLLQLTPLFGGGEAPGTITLDRVPEPAALASVLLGAALLPGRRRAKR